MKTTSEIKEALLASDAHVDRLSLLIAEKFPNWPKLDDDPVLPREYVKLSLNLRGAVAYSEALRWVLSNPPKKHKS